jgi:hypothetical protein
MDENKVQLPKLKHLKRNQPIWDLNVQIKLDMYVANLAARLNVKLNELKKISTH